MGEWQGNDGYVNGFIKRTMDGRYEGKIEIDGVKLSEIEGTYFTEKGENYLWLKRKPILEYDTKSETYNKRERKPKWEAYLKKGVENGTIAYKGVFIFLRFRYSIVGVWDNVLGKEKQRLNLFVERLPMNQQTIINGNRIRNENK